ncbi:nuclear pore complex subunit [Tilletia horrida]|uniref:Nuclear pore protein n=1 Tax=Tilletia horrida TaxID=155126 RepID=A0AAN6JQZ5_9BASI|nr:nuclear pore complex subunit [Tilletia horrida]KAK0540957.1 nuclear pore complex subunit [Tilletia horrida]KAK0565892.1 nuclear pore complex subunit [Tilletia horrida]
MASFLRNSTSAAPGGSSTAAGQGADAQPQSILAKLAADARRLNSQLPGRSELPSINYGLQQIESQSRRMHTGPTQADPNAAYFLAPAMNAAKLAEDVRKVDTRNTFESLNPILDTDIEGYLQHRHEQMILSTIEMTRNESIKDTLTSLDRSFRRDWERQKVKIFEELGRYQPMATDESETQASVERFRPQKAGGDTVMSMPAPSANLAMHSRMMQYDVVIQQLNQARLERTTFPISRAFLDVVQNFGLDAKTMPLFEAWQAVAALAGDFAAIGAQEPGAQTPVKERQYAGAYLDAARHYSTAEGRALRMAFVRGAKKYLETQYQGYIEATISAQPHKAQLGGEPTTEARVLAFLRVAHQDRDSNWSPELEVVQGTSGPVPVWAQIYVLLRIGEPAKALAFANDHEGLPGWTDPAFSSYLASYVKSAEGGSEPRLREVQRDKILAEYHSRIRNVPHVDPFKQALYKLLGRIDVHKKFPALLTRQTENWLWLQLSMVRESEEDGSTAGAGLTSSLSGSLGGSGGTQSRDRYTLYDLGQKILSFGEAHFDPQGQRALFYFQVLVLTGQFEHAVAYLSMRPQHQVDAVQLAAALTYYGLLRVMPEKKAPVVDFASVVTTETGHSVAYLDFAKLIQRYTRIIQGSDTREALQYIFLLSLNADAPGQTGEEQVRRCREQTRSVVLASKTIPDLLGEVRPDGTKISGFLERFLPLLKLKDQAAYLNNIVHQAAADAEERFDTRHAILLYNVAQDYDKVLSVLNKELGATLLEPVDWAAPGGPGAVGQVLAESSASSTTALAREILKSYDDAAHISKKLSVRQRQTCRTLLALKDFIDLYVARDLEKALERMEALNLIPLVAQDVSVIPRKAEEFKSVDESISRNLSDLLIITMKIIHQLHQTLKDSPYGDASRQQRMLDLRNKARNLMTWAGMLRLRMSNETYSQLTRLDVFIH